MQISEHYLAYPKKTLLVITNNELAKIYSVLEREIEEIKILKVTVEKHGERASGSEPQEEDELKKQNRLELYRKLNRALIKLAKEGYEEIILCAPEANKNELISEMKPQIIELIGENMIPKNLASLPLDQTIRILQESRGSLQS